MADFTLTELSVLADELQALGVSLGVVEKIYNESQHPRRPKGDPRGGEWASATEGHQLAPLAVETGGAVAGAAVGHMVARFAPPAARIPLELVTGIAVSRNVQRGLQRWKRYLRSRAKSKALGANEDYALSLKYNPDQPRSPKGSPIGGQWVETGVPQEQLRGGIAREVLRARDLFRARRAIAAAPVALPRIVDQQTRHGMFHPGKVQAVLRTLPLSHLRGVSHVVIHDTDTAKPTRWGDYIVNTGEPVIHLYGSPSNRGYATAAQRTALVRHEVGHNVQLSQNLLDDPEWVSLADHVLTHGSDRTFRYPRETYRAVGPYGGRREVFATAYAEAVHDPVRFRVHFPALAAYLKKKVPEMPMAL